MYFKAVYLLELNLAWFQLCVVSLSISEENLEDIKKQYSEPSRLY